MAEKSSTLKLRKPMAPLVSLNSFVLGFIIGCLVIAIVGLPHIPDLCMSQWCTVVVSTPPVNLDSPLIHPWEHKWNRDGENHKIKETVHTPQDLQESKTTKCPNRALSVVVLILASPSGLMRRNAIRGSWMHTFNSKNIKVTSKFLLGTLELSKGRVESLEQESSRYGDLLLFKTLKDSYYNLSLKVLHGMTWVERQMTHYDFVIKTDDDSYLQVEKVAKAYTAMGCPQNLYWGYFNGHGFPEAVGKWVETHWHTCPHYLPYAMGGGYILTRRVVQLLVRLSDRLLLYNNEDVTIGSWLAPFQLVRVHDMRFNVESVTRGCNNQYIITHKDTARKMHEKYKSLHKNGSLCSVEREIHPGYLYNWTVSPLDCCNRTKALPLQQSAYNGHLLPSGGFIRSIT